MLQKFLLVVKTLIKKYNFFSGPVLKISFFFSRFSFENIIFSQVQFWKYCFFSGSVLKKKNFFQVQFWKYFSFPCSVLKIFFFFSRFSFENIIFFQVQFWKYYFFPGSVLIPGLVLKILLLFRFSFEYYSFSGSVLKKKFFSRFSFWE